MNKKMAAAIATAKPPFQGRGDRSAKQKWLRLASQPCIVLLLAPY
jgi:hypothetical protein